MATLDHLVYATSDLDATVEALEAATGIRPEYGGAHPGFGTRNAQVALGGAYLELIGPDPAQPDPVHARPLGVGTVEGFVAFCIRPVGDERIDELVERTVGVDLGPIVDMSRVRPDGLELHWRLTMPRLELGAGVPFLIDWGDTPQPSNTVTARADSFEWQIVDPDPDRLAPVHEALALDVPVAVGASPAIVASVTGPAGTFGG